MRGQEPEAARRRAQDAGVGLAVAVAAALWDASFHAVPAADGVWRGIAGVPSPLRMALAVALGVAAALLSSRLPAAVPRPLLALLVAALPLVPVLTGRILALLVFQGPVLRLVAAAAVAVALARLAALRGLSPGRAPLAALFAAAFAFYAAWGVRVPGSGPQGDEPHYLLIAQSLLSDGDLDLADDLAGREYAPFYGGTLAPHTSPNTPPGRVYSMHSPGLPALLLPAYAAGGYRGAQLFQSALAALLAALLYRLVLVSAKDERIAAAAWALAAFAPPLPFYAVTLYPETLAALAIVVFLLAGRDVPGAPAIAAVTLLSAVLPWVHTKFIPLAAAGLAFTLLRPMRWRTRVATIALVAASLALLARYFDAHYANPSFTVALGPADVDPGRAPWGFAGAFLDRQYGLLAVAPVLALAVPGFVVLWRRRTGDALRAAVLAVLVAAPAAAYVGWWGGAAPPARYVLPVVGPLILAAAAVAPRARDAMAALGGIGLAVLGLAADAPRMLRNRPDGESLLLRSLAPDVDLNGWLPSFVEGGAQAPLLALSLLAAAALAWRFRGRGLLLGLAGYALVAHGLRDRPLIDRGQATQRLLWDWSDSDGWRPEARGGQALAIPFELPRAPWTLEPGEARNSRRLLLPPGAYRIEARTRAIEPPATVRLEVFAGDLPLGSLETNGTGTAVLPLLLPAGGRGVAVSAWGIAGRSEVEEVAVVPEALVPRETRGAFPWPESPEPGRYRVDSGGVRVTVLDRTAREDGGFRVREAGSFLVDGPGGGAVRVTLDPPGGVVEWSGGSTTAAGAVDVPLAGGVDLGRAAAIALRVRARDARVSFALAGR